MSLNSIAISAFVKSITETIGTVIFFGAVDSKSKESVDANIVVKDGISGAVLTPNSNGEYLLCEGDYLISATADGYRDAGQKLELSQATECHFILRSADFADAYIINNTRSVGISMI